MRILIAGGGIGGLTAALCLARQGHAVDVFEQSPVFAETGAGIQLSPNCTRVLHHLGLEAPLRDAAFLPEGTEFRQWRTGRVIAARPLGDAVVKAHGFPYYHIHRGDLLNVLVEAATQHEGIVLHTDARVSELDTAAPALRVNDTWHKAEVIVGADGIHSTLREILWGKESPAFTGNVAWRALVPAERLPRGLVRPMSTVWWGPGKHFVHYYVRGGNLVNCVCVVEKAGWEIESWTEPGDFAELQADFAGWHEGIQTLLAHAERDSLFKWALHDREPMADWGQGRVTLLGDACHPTLPFMAQGAAMAIEDASVLAKALHREAPIEENLRLYEHLRKPRTAGIQRGSRRNARVFHMSGLGAWLRNRAAKRAGDRAMQSLFGYDALNAVADSDSMA